jgi:hypothetical protein
MTRSPAVVSRLALRLQMARARSRRGADAMCRICSRSCRPRCPFPPERRGIAAALDAFVSPAAAAGMLCARRIELCGSGPQRPINSAACRLPPVSARFRARGLSIRTLISCSSRMDYLFIRLLFCPIYRKDAAIAHKCPLDGPEYVFMIGLSINVGRRPIPPVIRCKVRRILRLIENRCRCLLGRRAHAPGPARSPNR